MARAFTDELRDLRRGAFVDEAGTKLSELVNAVAITGKPGKIVIELTVKRAAKSTMALIISDKVTMKAPAESVDNETLMFPTPEGSLLTEDPRQTRLDLKRAPDPAAQPPKAVGVAD